MTPQFGVRKSVGVRWAHGSGRMSSTVRCGIDAGLAARAGFYAERARPFDLRRTRSWRCGPLGSRHKALGRDAVLTPM